MPPPPRTPAPPRTRSLTGTPTADPTTPARIRTPARTRTPDRDPCLDPDPCLAADPAAAPESSSDSRTPGHVDPATGSAPHPVRTPGSRLDATRPGPGPASASPPLGAGGLPGGGARGLPASRAGADPVESPAPPGPAWTRLASAPPPGPVADTLVRGRTPGGHRGRVGACHPGKGGGRDDTAARVPGREPGWRRLSAGPLGTASRRRRCRGEVRCPLISFLCSSFLWESCRSESKGAAGKHNLESPERESRNLQALLHWDFASDPSQPFFFLQITTFPESGGSSR